MESRTVEWPVPPPVPGSEAPETGGLRERKKRLMRQQLSDTATRMFLERGFDAVRVTEIAEACGVSEKTVFNYFPAKEALILDRLEATMASLKTGLADPGVSPVRAVLAILDGELGAMTSWLAAQDDPAQAAAAIRRFGALIWETPSLRAYQSDTDGPGHRHGRGDPGRARRDAPGRRRSRRSRPPPCSACGASSTAPCRDTSTEPARAAQVHQAVTADVRRAARLISAGLDSFPALAAVSA